MVVKDAVRRLPCKEGADSYAKFGENELTLNTKLMDTKSAVHSALCGEWAFTTLTLTHPHTPTHTHTHFQILLTL